MSETIIEKTIYFVRHGQTNGNILDTIQDLTDTLSPAGEIQAEKIAARAQNLEFEALLSSDAVRAKQTAAIIAKRTGHTVSHHDVFREIKRPSSFVGKLRLTDEFQNFDAEWRSHFDGSWRLEDEETQAEFLARAVAAVSLIEARPEKSMLVVSHGYFLRSIAAYILSGKKILPDTYPAIHAALIGENTGVTICRLSSSGHWRILSWNDHAHLG